MQIYNFLISSYSPFTFTLSTKTFCFSHLALACALKSQKILSVAHKKSDSKAKKFNNGEIDIVIVGRVQYLDHLALATKQF